MTPPPRPSPMAASSAPVRATDDSPHHIDTARPSVSALWRDPTVPTVGDRRRSRPLPVLWRPRTAGRDRRHRLVTPAPPHPTVRGCSHARISPQATLEHPQTERTHRRPPQGHTPPPATYFASPSTSQPTTVTHTSPPHSQSSRYRAL